MQKIAEDQLTNEEALNRWRDTAAGKHALQRVAPGELAFDVVGAAGGGFTGYWLSKALHRDGSALTRALYTLCGAVAGATGTQYALSHIQAGGGFKGTLSEKMRLANMPAWRDPDTGKDDESGTGTGSGTGAPDDGKEQPVWVDYDLADSGRLGESLLPNKYNLGAAAAGMGVGLHGKHGIDFSGARARQKAFDKLLRQGYSDDIKRLTDDLDAYRKDPGGFNSSNAAKPDADKSPLYRANADANALAPVHPVKPAAGSSVGDRVKYVGDMLKYEKNRIGHWLDNRGLRSLGKSEAEIEHGKRDTLKRGFGRGAIDAIGNAGAAYLLGAALSYGIDTFGASMARVNPAALPSNIR